MTTASDPNSDVDAGEFIKTDDEERLVDLRRGFVVSECWAKWQEEGRMEEALL